MKPLSFPATAEDHVLGSLTSPFVIVEYGDYDCPHTRAAHAQLHELLSEEQGAVSLVFRHFPLRHIHLNAEQLAETMEAIESPADYFRAHERLTALPRMSLPAAAEALRQVGLDPDELALRAEAARMRVERDVQRGLADGVHSTPSFFFNGAPHDGHYDLETLRAQLAAAKAR